MVQNVRSSLRDLGTDNKTKALLINQIQFSRETKSVIYRYRVSQQIYTALTLLQLQFKNNNICNDIQGSSREITIY